MKDNELRYTLRMDKIIFSKFKYIAKAGGRTANSAFEQCAKRIVENYEKKYGTIDINNN